MAAPDFETESNMRETVVPQRRIGNATTLALALGAAAAIAAVWYFSYKPSPKQKEQKKEEFRTTRQDMDYGFNTPSLSGNNRLILAPPPPAPPAAPPSAPIQPPVAAAPPPVQDDAADRAAVEAARLEAADREKRLNSPMVVVGEGAASGGGGLTANGGGSTGNGISDYKEDDPNRRFATAMSGRAIEMVSATRVERIDALVPAGTIIRGVLETAIQSDLPGMVRAKLSDDVYSFDGRRVLLPRDTTIVGTYRSGIARGQTRVLIIWERALRADGTAIALGSYGTDDLGRSGLAGIVDHHYLERFGTAAALSIVGGVSSFIAGLNIHGQSTTAGGGNYNSPSYQAENQAQQTVSQTMSDMANMALRDSINIPDTIHVDQGTQIAVFVQRDLDFSQFYPNPLKEALDELKARKRRAVR